MSDDTTCTLLNVRPCPARWMHVFKHTHGVHPCRVWCMPRCASRYVWSPTEQHTDTPHTISAYAGGGGYFGSGTCPYVKTYAVLLTLGGACVLHTRRPTAPAIRQLDSTLPDRSVNNRRMDHAAGDLGTVWMYAPLGVG